MKLREFALDAPDAPRQERHAFSLRTRCVAALYERCFPGLTVANGWKILVECVDVARPDVVRVAGVYMVQIPFDHARFMQEPLLAQKEIALVALHRGTTRVCELEKWPSAAFDAARQGVVEHGYTNTLTWPKRPAWNSRRSHRALLRCHHDADRFRAWLAVFDREGVERGATLAIDTDPSEFLFVPFMGAVRWTSEARVALFDRRGTEVASLAIDHAASTT